MPDSKYRRVIVLDSKEHLSYDTTHGLPVIGWCLSAFLGRSAHLRSPAVIALATEKLGKSDNSAYICHVEMIQHVKALWVVRKREAWLRKRNKRSARYKYVVCRRCCSAICRDLWASRPYVMLHGQPEGPAVT